MESQGTEGAGSAEGTGATEGSAAAPDTTSQATAVEAGGGVEDGGTRTPSTQPPTKLNYSEVHAKLEAGEDVDLTEEQTAEYEKWYASGMPKQDDNSQSNAEAPEKASQADGNVSAEEQAAWAEVGAKTRQEYVTKTRELRNGFTQSSGKLKQMEAEAKSVKAFFDDLAAGKPEAIEHWKRMTNKDFPATQPAAQPAQAAGQGASQFMLSEEQINNSLDPDLGRAFNAQIKALEAHFSGKLDSELQKLGANMKQYESVMNAERVKAAEARIQPQIVNDFLAVAEKYPDDYGLQDLPVRTLIENWLNGQDVPELGKFVEMLNISNSRKISLEDAHAIFAMPSMNEKLAQAKISNAKSAGSSAKPTVGVHGTTPKGSSSAEISDADAVAMAKGTMEIPDKYLDDGIPMKGKTPDNLYKLLTEVA